MHVNSSIFLPGKSQSLSGSNTHTSTPISAFGRGGFPRGGQRSLVRFDLGKAELGVPEIRMVLEEGPLSLQSLGQAHLVLDVLLAPALDNHVALLQVVDEVSHHVNDLVFRASVHQVGLCQDPCKSETFN